MGRGCEKLVALLIEQQNVNMLLFRHFLCAVKGGFIQIERDRALPCFCVGDACPHTFIEKEQV